MYGKIIKPDGTVVELPVQDLRRIFSLAREGLQARKSLGLRLTSTEVHVGKILERESELGRI